MSVIKPSSSSSLVLIILSLLLVTSAININNNHHHFYDLKVQNVFAQDDDNKEEEAEEEDNDDEDKKDQQQEQEQEPETSDEYNKLREQINATTLEQQGIKKQLEELLLLNNKEQQQQQNTTVAPTSSPLPPPPTIVQQQQKEQKQEPPLNLECNCRPTNDTETFIHPPPPNNTTTITTTTEPIVEEQIKITPQQDIKSSKSTGEVTDPAYTSFYTVSNLFDNVIDDYSFWSQAGKSSFTVQFDNSNSGGSGVLNDYQVCSIEIDSHNPKNIPYVLDIIGGLTTEKEYKGILDQTTETIQFDKCIKNIDQIMMAFGATNGQFISIGELKLFGKKVEVVAEPTTTTTPHDQNAGGSNNATKINIKNSTAEIDITNSTVTFKFDPQSAKATNYNIITIPNTEVVK